MQTNIKIDSLELDALTDILDILKQICELEGKIKGANECIAFLTIKETAEKLNWSIPTVQKLFNRPDFPSCDYGKEKVVEIHALINFFSVARRKIA
ncbi:MAG: hypothetical protein RR229_02380 [Oscillospiraceae bacterium]